MGKTMLEEVAEYVVKNQWAAASTIQRHLRMGYVKVQQMLSELERLGVVGPADGSRARDVLVPMTSLGPVLERVRESEAVGTDG
jgi:S-DNA-T family DNA segregation ATPase FtsK/SpoIIIE